MNTQEKLKRIKARCQELLAIAEKRTPGKWSYAVENLGSEIAYYVTHGPVLNVCLDTDKADAQYIASCAGPAEAGWRATIAAIDFYLEEPSLPDVYSQPCLDKYLEELAENIITAWPDEIL